MPAPNLLPDCRAKRPTGAKAGPWELSWIPIFCANCGRPGGAVPEENVTFAFYLCNGCVEKHGAVAGTLMVPDELFWRRVAEAQLERYGRLLTAEEWQRIAEDPAHPLHALLKEKPK